MGKTVSSKQYGVSRKHIVCSMNFLYCLLPTAYCLLLVTCSSIPQKETSGGKDIKEVYSKEVQYLKARVLSDMDKMYSFQHPEYKSIINLGKFVSSRGYARLDYSSVSEKNPLPEIYMPLQMFSATVKDFRIEKCFIDKSGRYAKFHMVHIMDLFLPIAKGLPVERWAKGIDYWEKFDGDWVVLNRIRYDDAFAHISGAVTTPPIVFPEEKAEYVEIQIEEIESVFEEKKGQK